MKKPDARKLPPEAQEDLRRRVVAAIAEGTGKSEAARLFKVSRQSIDNWLDAVAGGGSAALRPRKRGPKPHPTIDAATGRKVVRQIVDHCPDQLLLPFALWTREAVRELLDRRYGIKLAVTTVGRYLRSWGLTPQRPVRRAYEKDDRAVRAWLQERYPAIHARAKRENAEIHWGDEMGLRSDHQTGRSYSPKGQTPVVPGTGKRFSCSMISTITNRGSLSFMVYTKKFTAEVLIGFLARLLRQQPVRRGGKIFLIRDGHPVHKSAKARRWILAHGDRIELFLLPSYSPEVNPDELLNQDVKSNALGRRRPRDLEEMIAGTRSYLRSTQRQPHIVSAYFREEHVRYAAA